jgi:hypothetical protein
LTEILSSHQDENVVIVERPLPEHLEQAVALKIVRTPAIVTAGNPPLTGTLDKNELSEYIFQTTTETDP